MASDKPQAGNIVWHDLTVENAEGLRDFYAEVAGWQPHPVPMGEYSDYTMLPAGSNDAAGGICHARGTNANMPPQWLIYIAVEDVDAAASKCTALGGAVIDGPRDMGDHRFCVIKDPAGAVAALIG